MTPQSRNSITWLTLLNSSSGHEPFEKVEFHASNQKPLSGIEFAYGWPGFYEWSYGNTLLPVGAFFPAFSSKLFSIGGVRSSIWKSLTYIFAAHCISRSLFHRMFLEHWNRQKILSKIWQRFSCLLDEWIAKKCKKTFFWPVSISRNIRWNRDLDMQWGAKM